MQNRAMGGDGARCRVSDMKVFLGAILSLSLLWLVCDEILTNQATAAIKTISATGNNRLDVWKIIQNERQYLQKNSNLNYVSKTRVSTRPNVIQNRKTINARAIKHLDVWKIIGAERQHLKQNSNLNYVSKRRVPTGPNAIHNRRVGVHREAPARA